MEITILDSKGTFTTMAKKAAKASQTTVQTTSASAKPAAKKAKKHLKAQAAGVAAAVEGFVHAIVSPHEETVDHEEAGFDIEAREPEGHASLAEISHEAISKLAYHFYLERHRQNGSALDDWFRAEHQLQASASR